MSGPSAGSRGDRPIIDGVLVTFDRPEGLRDSLRAIGEQDTPLRRLWLVDNGDAPVSLAALHEAAGEIPDVRHIVPGGNIGPAGGFAEGIRRIMGEADPPDWVALFDDNDPPMAPSILSRLASAGEAFVRKGSPIGGVGLRGARMHWMRARTILPSLGADYVEVDHLHGGYVPLYRTEALRQAPNFEPALFFGFEELAFGLGLSGEGFPLYIHARLWDDVGPMYQQARPVNRPALTTIGDPRRRYYSLRNLLWILRHHGHNVVAVRVAFARGFVRPLVNAVIGGPQALPALVLSARAVVDAYRGNMGRTVDLRTSRPSG